MQTSNFIMYDSIFLNILNETGSISWYFLWESCTYIFISS